MATAHIIFVGLNKDWLIASIKQQKILAGEHILLVLGEQELPGEEIAQSVAEEIQSELGHLFEIKIFHIDKVDIIRAAGQLIDLIYKEKENGNNIVLNASGSLRTFAIAAYISGCLTGMRVFTAISDYASSEIDETTLKLVELPTLPIRTPKELPLRILNQIHKGNSTITGIIEKLNQDDSLNFSEESGELSSEYLDYNEEKQRYDINISANKPQKTRIPASTSSTKKYENTHRRRPIDMHKERGRISHHLKNLEEDGFIQRQREGKEVNWQLTDRGLLVLKVKESRKPKEPYNWRKHLKK